jgi:hypothetical protein
LTIFAQVWISLLAFTVILIFALKLASNWNKTEKYFDSYQRSYEYVIAVFFAQGNEGSLLQFLSNLNSEMIGGVCYPTATSIRLIAAVWCLAALVVTSIYNTTLISYVTSPNWQPLVRSIFDIPKMPQLRIVVDERMGADVIISVKLTIGSGDVFNFKM